MENNQMSQHGYENTFQGQSTYNQYNNFYYDSSIPKPSFYSYQNDYQNTTPYNYSQYTSSPMSNYYSYNSSYNQSYTPSNSYNNYYLNNTNYSNDSGYQTNSICTSPIVETDSTRTKLDFSNEIQPIEKQVCNKRKRFEEANESVCEVQEVKTQTKNSSGKRAKVLKLENLESNNVELKCNDCTNVFYSAAKLLMHQFVHHKNGNSKQCPVCLRKFGSYSNAMVHLRGHTQERLYQCKDCDKSFVDVSTLKKHSRIHSGERPYECHICNKKFSQSGNLSRHLLTHQQDENLLQTSEQQVFLQHSNESYFFKQNESESLSSYDYQGYYSQYQLPQNFQFNYFQSY
ncbi:unnamed protein product [Brachionus calyciflorus]|uniref:C2H2-type domain-containing protein n=1 Tax=Brachionus calyciflorus TaxID=104777 RepID=A0A813S6F0_9BILA|nr:unnamed protein product [Brachionus calyciflorus]